MNCSEKGWQLKQCPKNTVFVSSKGSCTKIPQRQKNETKISAENKYELSSDSLRNLSPDQVVKKVSSILANAILFSKNIEPHLQDVSSGNFQARDLYADLGQSIDNPLFVAMKLLKELIARQNLNTVESTTTTTTAKEVLIRLVPDIPVESLVPEPIPIPIKDEKDVSLKIADKNTQINKVIQRPINPHYIFGGAESAKAMEKFTKNQLDLLPRGKLIYNSRHSEIMDE